MKNKIKSIAKECNTPITSFSVNKTKAVKKLLF